MLFMVEIRKVRQAGGSASLTLPPSTDMKVGDYVEISLVDGRICLKKVDIDE